MIAGAPHAAAEQPIDDAELEAQRRHYFAEARRVASRLRELEPDAHVWPPPRTGIEALDKLVWFRYLYARPVPSEVETARLPPPLASE